MTRLTARVLRRDTPVCKQWVRAPCHPRARTERKSGTTSCTRATRKPTLTRETAVDRSRRNDLVSGRSKGLPRARCVPDRAVILGISRPLRDGSRFPLTCGRSVRGAPAHDLLSSGSYHCQQRCEPGNSALTRDRPTRYQRQYSDAAGPPGRFVQSYGRIHSSREGVGTP